MIYLLASILFNSLLVITFKLFGRWQVNNLYAIVINYLMCFVTGILLSGGEVLETVPWDHRWFGASVMLGLLFIAGFNVVAVTVQAFGITIATIMQKMSIIAVVIYGISIFGESAGPVKLIGLLCAILSIIAINWPSRDRSSRIPGVKSWLIIFPILTLLVCGMIDTTLFHLTELGVARGGDPAFVSYLFLTAGICGLPLILIMQLWKPDRFRLKDLAGGVVLGIFNYFSVFFIMKMLSVGWEGSLIFPINNIGILLVSVLASLLLFGERLSPLRWGGVALSIAAILILAAANPSH